MYALIIDDDVLIFDLDKHYGIYKLNECTLVGFLKVLNYYEIVNYCSKCMIDPYEIVEYSDFLHNVCVGYIKDYF